MVNIQNIAILFQVNLRRLIRKYNIKIKNITYGSYK